MWDEASCLISSRKTNIFFVYVGFPLVTENKIVIVIGWILVKS